MIFVVSTYGEGGPTDDCIEFNNALDSKSFFSNFENSHLCYSIFGLGSTKYENYNSMSKKFDKFFQKAGMKRISEVGLGDEAKDINEDFDSWKKSFWTTSYSYFLDNKEKYNKIIEKMNLKGLYENLIEEVEYHIVKEEDNNKQMIQINEYDYNTKRFLQAEECVIEDIHELRKENINGSTLKITYSLENSNIKYCVADNLGIYPTNSDSSVKIILNRLNYNPNDIVVVKKLKENIKKKVIIQNGCSIKDILTNFVDLSCQIK